MIQTNNPPTCSFPHVFSFLEPQFGSGILSVCIFFTLIICLLGFTCIFINRFLCTEWGKLPSNNSNKNLYGQELGSILHSIQLSILKSLKNHTGLFFLFGEYGSGKTTNIRQAFSLNSPTEVVSQVPRYKYINLADVSSINQAIFKLLSPGEKFVVIGLGGIVIGFYTFLLGFDSTCVEPYSIVVGSIFIFLTFVFLEDRYAIIFKIFNSICPKNFILDDIERSTLSKEESFVFFKKISSVKDISLVIVLGYGSDVDKLFWLEASSKENSKTEILPILDVVVTGILTEQFKNLFSSLKISPTNELWTTFFSPRDILKLRLEHDRVVSRFRPILLSNTNNIDSKVALVSLERFIFIHIFINELFRKFKKVNTTELLDTIALSAHKLDSHAPTFKLRVNFRGGDNRGRFLSTYELNLINSLLETIDFKFIVRDEEGFRSSIGNLIDTELLVEELSTLISSIVENV